MAISAEAYEYLREVEKIPKWTELPDNDERIMKLRVLFDTPVKERRKNKNPARKNRPIKATKNGTYIIFENTKQCAEFLGIQPDTISKAIRRGFKSSGYSFERLEEMER